uniref:Uncharacterized protein n=1 Tax=Strigamia maritima TaxID=126957 RepID=T1JM23_STRMM
MAASCIPLSICVFLRSEEWMDGWMDGWMDDARHILTPATRREYKLNEMRGDENRKEHCAATNIRLTFKFVEIAPMLALMARLTLCTRRALFPIGRSNTADTKTKAWMALGVRGTRPTRGVGHPTLAGVQVVYNSSLPRKPRRGEERRGEERRGEEKRKYTYQALKLNHVDVDVAEQLNAFVGDSGQYANAISLLGD